MKQEKTKVVLLGTGNPNPDPHHSGPALAIIVDDTSYLIDAGPGLVRQAATLVTNLGRDFSALKTVNLKKLFLTHLHSDHTIGYPDLILTPWVMGRTEPLEVFGPEGTQKLTQHLLKAYQEDIHYRLFGLEPATHTGWKVNVHEISEGRIYSDKNLKVDAFLANHGNWPNAYGYRFQTPDKVIVISGDTAPCKNILEFSKGADILIHEVYYHAAFTQLDKKWRIYHACHHTSTLELANLAQKTQPGLLVTYHTLYWGATDQDILGEIKSIYNGAVSIGEDFLVIG
jgi:ribonuclease Z